MALVASAFVSFVLRFSNLFEQFVITTNGNQTRVDYISSLMLISLGWIIVLKLNGSRNPINLGAGNTEYRLVADSMLFIAISSICILFILNASYSRQVIFTFLILGTLSLLFGRWICRRILYSLRKQQLLTTPTAIVGNRENIEKMLLEIRSRPESGVEPIYCFIVNDFFADSIQGVPASPFSTLLDNSESIPFEILLIAGTDGISESELKNLLWELDPSKQRLLISPRIYDVSGPRMKTRPFNGLSLFEVQVPEFMGVQRILKRFIDILGATILLVLLSPIFIITAIFIKISDKGPIFFWQERVGLKGSRFKIYKFRSMSIDAESRLSSLKKSHSKDSNSVLFKLADDPRVTKVGKFIRKWSIDELPQLFNVIIGNMSLVGPRPPLPDEVELYDDHVHRKFLVKPGITGPWQVGGRSNLSWEDSVKLDLYYVENWSVSEDVAILLRTVGAVLRRNGSY